MNIICLKCTEKILLELIEKVDKLILIDEQWDLKNINYSDYVGERLYAYYTVKSLDSIEELTAIYIDIKKKNIVIDKVMSGAEYGMLAAGFFDMLIKDDTSKMKMAINTRNKQAMKEIYEQCGIEFARGQFYGDIYELEKVSDKLHYPVVVKPACGVASCNTRVIKNKSELEHFLSIFELDESIFSEMLIVEDYIRGDEYHADIVWKDGECCFLSISRYLIPRVEIWSQPKQNGSYVLKERLYIELYESVKDLHMRIMKKLGDFTGVTHTEFFINNGKIIFSEIATRFAGAFVPESIFHTVGVDIIQEWIKVEIGEECVVKEENNENCCGWINFTPLKTGDITSIPKREEFFSCNYVKDVSIRAKEGERFIVGKPSDWSVFLVIEGEDIEQFRERIEELYSLFEIKISEA